MKTDAPERETTGTWDEQAQAFVYKPEPVTRWLQRALLAMYGSEPRKIDIIDPLLTISNDVRWELLKEISIVPVSGEPTFYYGCRVKVDPELTLPFQLEWTTRREQLEARVLREEQERIARVLDPAKAWFR